MFSISNKSKKDAAKKLQVDSNETSFDFSEEEKCFKHINELIELTNQIDSNVNALVKEEGTTTYGLSILLKGTEYTTEQTEQVNNFLKILSENSKNTKKFVDDVFDSLDDSHSEIENAKGSFERLINQVNVVSGVFDEFLKLIIDIQTNYESIQKFANIITSIAQQTNLLSLNASIEAARAGESGKGFSVVASEIKKLSVGTKENAEDIMNSLKKLTESMELLTDKSKEGSSAISNTSEAIKDSSSVLERIINAEGIIQKHVESVQSSQNDNLKGIDEISTNLTNIVNKSKSENQQLEIITYSIQKKADCYINLLNNLYQIKLLEEE